MNRLKKLLHRNIYPIFTRLLPINKNKIVFTSYYGRQYSGSPRVISEKLHKMCSDVEIVWLMNDSNKRSYLLPEYVKVVEYESFAASYELYTAKVWVDNCRKLLFFNKRNSQKYIQTWHGTPLKLIEEDAKGKLGKRYRKYANRDTKNIDVLLSGNEYSTEILRRSFMYSGKIAQVGMPRNDLFLSNDKQAINKVKSFFNIKNKKIILYAPTFRDCYDDNGLIQLKKITPSIILKEFRKKYSTDCVLLYRFHPNVSAQINGDIIKEEYGEELINASTYPDMQELLLASDVLLTDYSSSFFDYCLLKRPIFLYIYDYENYIEERGLYLELDQLPFNISRNSNELKSQIIEMNLKNEEEKCNAFLKNIGNAETGKSTNKIVEDIMNMLRLDEN